MLEVHDFSIPDKAENRSNESGSSDDGDDGYLGYDVGPDILQPSPRIYLLIRDPDAAGNPLSCLPQQGGGARWSW
jgi:hypothetical protein